MSTNRSRVETAATMEHQFPLPGVAVFILANGLAWLVFAGILLLIAKRWPENPITDALNDLYGSGSAA